MTTRCPWCDSPSHVADTLSGCNGWQSATSRRLNPVRVEWLIFPIRGDHRIEMVREVGEAADAKMAHGESVIVSWEKKPRDSIWPE